MYKLVSENELFEIIDGGYTPVWFAIENGELLVDLCVNYRLSDGKILFLKFYSADLNKLAYVSNEVAKKAREAWTKIMDNNVEHILSGLDDAIKVKAIIDSVKWIEGATYRFTYAEDNIVDYLCISAEEDGSEIIMKKKPGSDPFDRYLSHRDEPLRAVLFANTKVELI